jgi:hypothetical protein
MARNMPPSAAGRPCERQDCKQRRRKRRNAAGRDGDRRSRTCGRGSDAFMGKCAKWRLGSSDGGRSSCWRASTLTAPYSGYRPEGASAVLCSAPACPVRVQNEKVSPRAFLDRCTPECVAKLFSRPNRAILIQGRAQARNKLRAITGSRAFHLMTSSVQGEQGGRHFEVLVLMVVK